MPVVSNLRDVFKCPGCEARVGYGDKFCRNCGREFSSKDVRLMKKEDMQGVRREVIIIIAVLFFIAVLVGFTMYFGSTS